MIVLQSPSGLSTRPAGAVYCVGRNYADHARELANPVPTSPLIFMKSPACIVPFEGALSLPVALGRCDHELEIAVRIGSDLVDVDEAAALGAISHMGLALALTRRDVQSVLKKKGHPWDLAKSFPGACPLTPLRPVEAIGDHSLRLTINGEVRQQGRCSQMIFSIGTLVAFLSRHMPLRAGDLLLTGTPAGVGPLHDGDVLVGFLDDEPLAELTVVRS